MTTNPDMYTAHEIARMLRVSPMTVYRHINEGRLRAFRIGRTVRVSENALNDFMRGADTWEKP